MEKYRRWWLDPNVRATTLLILAARAWKNEFFDWDPETIRDEIKATFGVEPRRSAFNKLMAAVRLVTSDAFYKSVPDFVEICNALDSGFFDPTTFDPADAGEIAWGVTEALIISPPDRNDPEPFSRDVLAYIGEAVKAEGIIQPPDVLRLGILGREDLWQQIQEEFSDDPEMFNAIYDLEAGKTEEINNMVKARLQQLMAQLRAIGFNDQQATAALADALAG